VAPLVLLTCALVVIGLLIRSTSEPRYQGKPLTAWLKTLENWEGDTNDAAFVAFRGMSTNMIPRLLNAMQSRDQPIQTRIMELNRVQSIVNLPFGTPWRHSIAASWALYAMGTNARAALPVLTNLLFHTNALITATIALAGIGSEAVPVLLVALTNRNYRIRHSVANGLGFTHADWDVVVPALIARLQDSVGIVRYEAVNSLGRLHAKPELAVPALMDAFATGDPLLRSLVLISLGQFEFRAKEGVPMIVAALKDKDESVRRHEGVALKEIDPAAATKAGVE